MSMILASLQLNNFKFENNINQTDFIDFVGHKDISMTKAYNKRKQRLQDSLSFSL